MEDEATPKTERSSAASSSQNLPGDANDIMVPSFSPPSSPAPTGSSTLTRLGMSLRAQAAAAAGGAAGAPGAPGGGQVSAITVVALLDKLVNMLESVQENQQRMEQRQAELEGAVRTVQGDVTRLSKVHLNTANNVNKLLERSRKVGGGVKEVKERLDKQAVQVKRLENNHAHLLKRNHFKVLIFQEDNEIPTDVFVRDSLKTPLPAFDEEGSVSGSMAPPSVCGSVAGSVAASVAPSVAGSMAPSVDMRSPEECLQNVSLTSDEEDDLATHRELLAEIDADSTTGSGFGRPYERRADRFKRNSLKKVDSLKKAFTRQNIEKKVTQITTKIVPPEKREKIIKSFSPNHPKSPTAKSSSFKVTPMTFNVKKTRDGDTSTPETSPSYAAAHVEIPPLGSLDGERPLQALGDVRDTAAAAVEAAGVDAVAQVREALNEVSVGAEISVNGDVNGDDHSAGDVSVEEKQVLEAAVEAGVEAAVEAVGSAGLAVPESVDDVGEDEEEEEECPAEGAAAEPDVPKATVTLPTAGIALEQAS